MSISVLSLSFGLVFLATLLHLNAGLGAQNESSNQPTAPAAKQDSTDAAQDAQLQEQRAQLFEQADILSNKLMRESTSAFDRGLLSLPRYITHQNFVLQLAELQGNEEVFRAALQRRIQRLRRAANRLRRFNQPASKGWQADLFLAELATADAEATLRANVDGSADPAALQYVRRLSDRHVQQRIDDYRMGLASLQQLTDAAAYLHFDSTGGPNLYSSEASVNELSGVREIASRATRQTERFAAAGAGIGREDRLLMARFSLSRIDAYLSELTEQNQQTQSDAWRLSQSVAEDLFRTQARFLETGTADIFDLADAMWSRQRIRANVTTGGLDELGTTGQSIQTDLDRLDQYVARTRDLRGQNAPNATFAGGLQLLFRINQLQSKMPKRLTPDS